jgi:hypothetical protein
MTGCAFCADWLRHKSDPTVARLLDRLRDEMTVLDLRASTPEPVMRRMRRGLTKPRSAFDHRRGNRDEPRRRVLAELAGGPLTRREVAEAAYGSAAVRADPERAVEAARTLLRRLVVAKAVVRVGHGWYALPDARGGMRHRTRADCAAVLARPNPSGGAGWTAAQIADRFGVALVTAQKWIARLRDEGYDVRSTPERRPDGQRTYRYRIERAQTEKEAA